MKLLGLLFLALISLHAEAATTGRLVGPFMLVSLASHSASGGAVDSTPQRLYELMNVPEKPSNMGPGKALAINKQILNFVCNDRGQGAFQCVINIHKTEFSNLGPGKATFLVTGAMAKSLFDQLHSTNGTFNFRDDNNQFAIEATPDRFLIVFSSSGV